MESRSHVRTGSLHQTGLAARTIGHAHRVLHQALGNAQADDLVAKNVCRLHKAPQPAESEMVIAQDMPGFIAKIQGSRLYAQALVALVTGMCLGEVLALRDRHVDLEKRVIYVREALEETQAHGVRAKAPKTKAGRRDITLPDIAVRVLGEHRRQLLETRMKLGVGKLPNDGLLFSTLEGNPLRPSTVSSDWGDIAASIGRPEVTFHALRHTRASQLIASNVDIVTISKRLGHKKPSITLAIYAHMFHTDDRKAAAAVNAALGE